MKANPSIVRTNVRADATEAARELNRKDYHAMAATLMEKVGEWLSSGNEQDMGKAILLTQEMSKVVRRL